MFDTEASLLNMFGQSPKHRPYSGTIDPGQAVKELAKVEDGNTPPATHTGVTLLDNVTGVIPKVTSALLDRGGSGSGDSQPLLGTDHQ